MWKRLLTGGLLTSVGGFLLVWAIFPSTPINQAALDSLAPPDLVNGERVFWAAGCASCHAGEDATGTERLILTGGRSFETEFGTFRAPNISPDAAEGIGDWSLETFLTAMQHGRSPSGLPYYPAFPYTAYRLAETQDMVDLYGYLQSLPADPTPSPQHDLGFPFNLRLGVFLWQALYLERGYAVTAPLSAEAVAGRYLVEAMAHCGECHSPRTALGAVDYDNWLRGAANPSGQGRIPALTPDHLTWSKGDIAAYLNDGFTPSFDSAGGHMVDVIRNMAMLTPEDRAAIAQYLKELPAPAP
ncbi:cytochrome c [Rhodobacteraceae bacterium XHP0102]|nr:cytochrome c [Rhodobacteraceae bacterium XHP0102]